MHSSHLPEIELIWQQYRTELLRFIVSRIHDKDHAEDLLHDVFLKIYQKIDTLDDESRLTAWIYSVTRNAVTDYLRKNHTKVPIEHIDHSTSLPDPFDFEDAKHCLSVSFQKHINQLPELYREAIYLAELVGLKHKQVAERQNISLHAAKSRICRGRHMLKEILLECCHFEVDKYGTIMDMYPRQRKFPQLSKPHDSCSSC